MKMKRDLYQEITNSIIASLDAGVAPWIRPWNTKGHHNYVTGRCYRGINPLLLSMRAHDKELPETGWLTYKQAQEAGGQVRKGEKGSLVTFFKMVKDKNGEVDVNGNIKLYPMLRHFIVFNEGQIDGLPEKETIVQKPEDIEATIKEKALLILNRSEAEIVIGGDSACYRPATDKIHMPKLEDFNIQDGASHWWATTFHELIHWTGGKGRIDRLPNFPSHSERAYEELIAELGASYLCAAVGIASELQHADYIGSWLEALNNDKRFIFRAATEAQKAADFLLEKAGLLELVDFEDAA